MSPTDDMFDARRNLAQALNQWANAGGPIEIAISYLEAMIAAKVEKMLTERAQGDR